MNAPRPGSNSSDPRFREIPRERVSDRVASELLQLIADGKLTPGERLPGERQLAAMMGVSRVSIRAALQQLKAQGLLLAVQGGGTKLLAGTREVEPALDRLPIDSESLDDVLEIRSVLESWAARRAADRANQQQLGEIEEAHRALLGPVDAEDKGQAELRFQQAVAKASGSRFYLHMIRRLRDTLEAAHDFQRRTLPRSPEAQQAATARRAAIVAAIRDRAPTAAASAVQAHLEFQRESHRETAAADAPSRAAE